MVGVHSELINTPPLSAYPVVVLACIPGMGCVLHNLQIFSAQSPERTYPVPQQSSASCRSVTEHIARTLLFVRICSLTWEAERLTVTIYYTFDGYIIASINQMIPSSQWGILSPQVLF